MRYHPLHDILAPLGFLTLLAAVYQIKEGGILFVAPPCSTWVWVSSSSTGRRKGNYNGNADANFKLKSQNRLISRLCHLLWLCLKRCVHYLFVKSDYGLSRVVV